MRAHQNVTFLLPKIILSTLLMFYFTSAILQANEQEKQLALEVYPQWLSTEDYTVQGNIGIVKEYGGDSWIQYYLKPSATYALDNNWAVHGGLGGYYKNYQESESRWEIRPYVGVSHYHPWTANWMLSSYLRAEERYFYYRGDEENTNTLRLRFRLRSAYTFNPISVASSWHRFTAGAEVFRSEDTDENTINVEDTYDFETRIVLGLERSLNKKKKLRFELGWRYQSLPNELSSAAVNTVYFKIKYYPVWGGLLGNRLFNRGIDE